MKFILAVGVEDNALRAFSGCLPDQAKQILRLQLFCLKKQVPFDGVLENHF